MHVFIDLFLFYDRPLEKPYTPAVNSQNLGENKAAFVLLTQVMRQFGDSFKWPEAVV